jgi:hypothetical protein
MTKLEEGVRPDESDDDRDARRSSDLLKTTTEPKEGLVT